MPVTLDAVKTADTIAKPKENSEADTARELVRMAREQGLSLTGPDGLLKQLTKTVIETALDEELTEHLGYEKHDAAGKQNTSGQNGCNVQLSSRHGTRLIRGPISGPKCLMGV
jgi:putative transposase